MAFLQTPRQMQWYDTLRHSSLTPPEIVFPIVWTILYALIAVSTAIVWEKGGKFYYFLQLAIQILWSYSFFVAHTPLFALAVLILLCIAVGLMLLSYIRYSKIAGLLLTPYFAWLLFAAYLNLATVLLN